MEKNAVQSGRASSRVAQRTAGVYDGGKERTMIELTPEQTRAIGAQKAPVHLLNPATQEVFVLIRKDVYDLTCSIVGGGKGQVWDDKADDDLILRKPS